MKKTSLLLLGIVVALIICANPMMDNVRSYKESDGHADIRNKRIRPFPATDLRPPKGPRQTATFI